MVGTRSYPRKSAILAALLTPGDPLGLPPCVTPLQTPLWQVGKAKFVRISRGFPLETEFPRNYAVREEEVSGIFIQLADQVALVWIFQRSGYLWTCQSVPKPDSLNSLSKHFSMAIASTAFPYFLAFLLIHKT